MSPQRCLCFGLENARNFFARVGKEQEPTAFVVEGTSADDVFDAVVASSGAPEVAAASVIVRDDGWGTPYQQ